MLGGSLGPDSVIRDALRRPRTRCRGFFRDFPGLSRSASGYRSSTKRVRAVAGGGEREKGTRRMWCKAGDARYSAGSGDRRQLQYGCLVRGRFPPSLAEASSARNEVSSAWRKRSRRRGTWTVPSSGAETPGGCGSDEAIAAMPRAS